MRQGRRGKGASTCLDLPCSGPYSSLRVCARSRLASTTPHDARHSVAQLPSENPPRLRRVYRAPGPRPPACRWGGAGVRPQLTPCSRPAVGCSPDDSLSSSGRRSSARMVLTGCAGCGLDIILCWLRTRTDRLRHSAGEPEASLACCIAKPGRTAEHAPGGRVLAALAPSPAALEHLVGDVGEAGEDGADDGEHHAEGDAHLLGRVLLGTWLWHQMGVLARVRSEALRLRNSYECLRAAMWNGNCSRISRRRLWWHGRCLG